jgi:hypothetical protein
LSVLIQLTKTDGGALVIPSESIRSISEHKEEKSIGSSLMIPKRTIINWSHGGGGGLGLWGSSSETIYSAAVVESVADIEIIAGLRIARITRMSEVMTDTPDPAEQVNA